MRATTSTRSASGDLYYIYLYANKHLNLGSGAGILANNLLVMY